MYIILQLHYSNSKLAYLYVTQLKLANSSLFVIPAFFQNSSLMFQPQWRGGGGRGDGGKLVIRFICENVSCVFYVNEQEFAPVSHFALHEKTIIY